MEERFVHGYSLQSQAPKILCESENHEREAQRLLPRLRSAGANVRIISERFATEADANRAKRTILNDVSCPTVRIEKTDEKRGGRNNRDRAGVVLLAEKCSLRLRGRRLWGVVVAGDGPQGNRQAIHRLIAPTTKVRSTISFSLKCGSGLRRRRRGCAFAQ